MILISLLFLFCILIDVRSVVSLPTKDEICGNPTIEGGLALTDPDGDTTIQRYLFYGQYILPYIRDDSRQEIDWKNIGLIKETFGGLPDYSNGVQFAFEYQSDENSKKQVYIRFRKDNNFYIFDRSDSGFELKGSVKSSNISYEGLLLVAKTNTENTISESVTYFFDLTSDPSLKPETKVEYFNYTNGLIKIMVFNCPKCVSQLVFDLFPIALLFTNNRGKRIVVPLEFDGYYQTKYSETIFFKRQSACVTIANRETIPREAEYCRRFVDTRTIIGCTSNIETNTYGREIDLSEPEDIEPDF